MTHNTCCAAAQGLQLVTDSFSGAASDADVDFIEYQRARRGLFLGLGRRFFNCYFKGEEDAGELAAGGDLDQGFERFAGIRRD